MTPADVGRHLNSRQVPWAVIGATALASYGVARSSLDVDLLVTDRRCLDPGFWTPLAGLGTIDVRRGDHDDPLAGVVRVSNEAVAIDIIVGRHAWQEQVLARATPKQLAQWEGPVVTKTDLVLLKLFAGGSQDKWDIEQLLAGDPALAAAVSASVEVLPQDAQRLWRELNR
ncbi:MAG: nucleotidyltransferase [Vicinamibacterales bacterium]